MYGILTFCDFTQNLQLLHRTERTKKHTRQKTKLQVTKYIEKVAINEALPCEGTSVGGIASFFIAISC